jgi:ribosomal protein S6E (S10)
LTKEGTLEPLENLERTEGTNPNQEVISAGKDGEETEKLQFLAMYKIKGSKDGNGFAIRKDQYGIVQLEYFRKLKYQDLYMSCSAPKEDRNR